MSKPAISPQEVFRTSLPAGTSLMVIFVPSLDRDGQAIDQDHWVDEVLATLARLFRGATAYPRGKGVWRDDQRGGALLKEEPVIVFSYIAKEALTTAALGDVYRTLKQHGTRDQAGRDRCRSRWQLLWDHRIRRGMSMLSEEEIRRSLHARRVVALPVANPHGPLGLEHLAGTVRELLQPRRADTQSNVCRPIEFSLETWEKLVQLASANHVSAGDLAAAIVEQYVESVEH